MDNELVETFHESLARCQMHQDFLHRFYKRFINSSEEVRKKFQSTNIAKQVRAMSSSFYLIMLSADGNPESQLHLDRIATLHNKKNVDIQPELYEGWLDCLVDTVKECDPRFDFKIENAWRQMMRPGIEQLKAAYNP